MGASGIPFSEIEAWQRLQGVTLTPWELDVLIEIDRIALNRANKKTEGG